MREWRGPAGSPYEADPDLAVSGRVGLAEDLSERWIAKRFLRWTEARPVEGIKRISTRLNIRILLDDEPLRDPQIRVVDALHPAVGKVAGSTAGIFGLGIGEHVGVEVVGGSA